MRSLSNNAEMFVPTEDVTRVNEAGLTIQVAVKDVPIPMAEAKRLGLVKAEKKSDPEPAAENKAGKPDENKGKGGSK